MVPCRNPRRKNVVQIDLLREENRLTLKSSLWVRFVCIFGISGFNFFIWFFLFLYKKLGNIGYDTKKKGKDILSRQRRLLGTIWMKCLPVVPRYLVFRLGVKNLLSIYPKYLTWPICQKTPKIGQFFRYPGARRI